MNVLSGPTLAILSYCTCSIVMTVTNKLVLSSYDFKMNFLLLCFQSLVCVLMLEVFVGLGIAKHRKYSQQDAAQWFVVSLSLVFMIYSGSKAIQYLSIPLFTVFKNLTIILIAYAERFFLNGARVSPMMLLSFGLIVMSSLVSGWADITSPKAASFGQVLLGYTWMTFNCLSTTMFSLMMKFKIKHVQFKDFDTVFYNNLLSVPVLFLFSVMMEQQEFFKLQDKYFVPNADTQEFYALLAGILVSGVTSFGISYSTAWCVRVTSSTTYSMVGALNKLPIAVAGMLFFDADVTVASVAGVMIAFAAGIVYAKAKQQQQQTPLPTYEPVNPKTN
ncbi:hypothetical protein EDD86DRAFT_191867 [Gorgonomyces haynaldii]|nr:hypothetical protein EDD86DRAFT_191867 [Gorgonomyces haynaldii]